MIYDGSGYCGCLIAHRDFSRKLSVQPEISGAGGILPGGTDGTAGGKDQSGKSPDRGSGERKELLNE